MAFDGGRWVAPRDPDGAPSVSGLSREESLEMELAGVVVSEAVVVGFGLVDGAVALPALVTALEPRHVDSEGAYGRWKLQ